MPANESPTNPKRRRPAANRSESDRPESDQSGSSPVAVEEAPAPATPPESDENPASIGYSTSRYVDYDTHELLAKISDMEDERRWQRIREGIWISIIAHILLFSGLTWIPRYVFHQPQLIDPFDAIKKRKDLTYLDQLPDALKEVQKAKPKLKPNETHVDKKTLEALKALEKAKPAPPKPEPQQAAPPPPPAQTPPQPQQQAAVTPPTVAPPQPAPQLPLDAPRPAPVPAKPNFSLGSQNPADQLRQAMKDSAHGTGSSDMQAPALTDHAGGGLQVLSDTQGVNFGPYLQKVIRETYRTWYPLIPEEVNPPILKRGECEVVFTILPNGRLQPHAMILTGRSGDVALDRAAWGSIEGADYPPLPREFHGPYLQLRFRFQYNVR
jgi:hypothetical protein